MNDKGKFPFTSYIKGGFIATVIRVCHVYVATKSTLRFMFIVYRMAFRSDMKSYTVWYKQERSWAVQVVHTHRKLYWSGWPRGSGELNTEPHFCIFTSASVGSSSRSYSSTSATVRIPGHTWEKATWYVTIHFQDRRDAASLRVFCLLLHRLQSSEIQVVGVASRSRMINRWKCVERTTVIHLFFTTCFLLLQSVFL